MNQNTYHVFFTNFSNQLKIKVILSLRDKEKSVSELSKELKVEQSKLSHALSSLRCCNIVNVKQEGKKRVYYLNKSTIVPILKIIERHANTFCKHAGACCKCAHKEVK